MGEEDASLARSADARFRVVCDNCGHEADHHDLYGSCRSRFSCDCQTLVVVVTGDKNAI